jgi:hypothetical protein
VQLVVEDVRLAQNVKKIPCAWNPARLAEVAIVVLRPRNAPAIRAIRRKALAQQLEISLWGYML